MLRSQGGGRTLHSEMERSLFERQQMGLSRHAASAFREDPKRDLQRRRSAVSQTWAGEPVG